MTLREYQLEAVESVEAGWSEATKQLIVVPTGGGKTVIFSHLAHRALPKRTLILAHREELIDQAIDKLHAATGVHAQKEKAEFSATLHADVVVASIQTMQRRLAKWPRSHFGLVVVDEAHHALADSYRAVLAHFDGTAHVLGVTATPDRGDRRNLGTYFERLACEVGLFDLVNAGYLSPISIKSVPLQIDLDRVKSSAGDFDSNDLGDALEPYLKPIAEAIRDHARCDGLPRRTLAFLPLIATSQKFVAACQEAGLSAAHVDGQSPNRADILGAFSDGEFDLLSNAMLLTEGFDDPGIDCVVVLRPTRSRPLYAQMVGRGTRIHPGKQDLLLLDFLWMHQRHRIVRPASLIAKSDDEADAITAVAEEAAAALPESVAEQLPMDLQHLASEAQQKREQALRKRLEEQAHKKAQSISAEEFAIKHDSFVVAEYEPTLPWETQPITDKQRTYLERAKIDVDTVNGRGHASQLLSLYFEHGPLRRASPKQQSVMRRFHWRSNDGQRGPGEATAAEAAQFFKELNARKLEKRNQPTLV